MANERPIYCPFWVTDSKKSITCEGIIGVRSQNVFFRLSEKTNHKNDYCVSINCKKCKMYKAIMLNYNE